MATLLSVNIGLPKNVSWRNRTVHTGVWKRSVDGPRMVRRLNVDGDGQGDLEGHGGEQRAVLVYQIESYRHWADHFGREDFEYGEFGENFTVSGLGDDEVCVGDRYRIGEAEFEVTQPRVTCYRVAMRLGEPELPALLVAHHRPGFYLRVIIEGRVEAGDEIIRTRMGRHSLTVADIDGLLYLPGRDTEMLHAAVDIPALSPGWQQSFRELLDAADRDAASAEAGRSAVDEPAWRGFRRLRVTELVAETPSVMSVYLGAESGQALARPKAGQYLTLRASGAGDPPPVRSYSLSSTPDAENYRISVKLEPSGVVSGYLHSRLRPGSFLDVAAPRGDFVLTDSRNPVLLISAGIGVTPVLAMLHQLAAMASTREVWWIHTARNATQHPFADEAHRLLVSLPRAHEHIFYTAGQPVDHPCAESAVLPVDRTSVPAEPTVDPADPAVQTDDPDGRADQSDDPDDQTIGPADQTIGPADQTIGPAGETVGPAGQTVDPAGQTDNPASQIAVVADSGADDHDVDRASHSTFHPDTPPDGADPLPTAAVSIGRPTLAALAGLGIPVDAIAYICGPASFMSAMHDACLDLGITGDWIHTELFGARSAINPGVTDARSVPPHQPAGVSGTGPQITFARSGLTVRWSSRHRSLLELADSCDVPTRWSCRTGVCHTCVTPIISGDITYDPDPLELPERGQTLICCAQPTSDVVVDL